MTLVLCAVPHVTENARTFLGAVVALAGVRVAVVTQDAAEAFPLELRDRLAGHWKVADALDADQLVQAATELASRLGTPHRYLGAVEQIQEPLAEARERLGIPGMRAEQARNFRDKARMKELLRGAGLPCARHRLVSSSEEGWAFEREVGYPVVVKPPAGAASQHTFRVESDEQMAEALQACAPTRGQEALVEEFITGDEYSWDAYSLDGSVRFHSITRYAPTPLEVMRTPWIQWTVLLPREVDDAGYDDVRVAGAQALRVLGMETGMCHMEWFRRRDGTLAISEIAARPPGAQITTLIARAHDWDAVGAWARLMVFDAIEPPPERKYAAGAAYLRGQGEGRVRAVHGLDVVHRELGHLVTDARVPRAGQPKAASYEGEGFIVVRHPDTTVVADALKRIVSTVRVELGA